jgi:hypothetical protein
LINKVDAKIACFEKASQVNFLAIVGKKTLVGV